MRRGRDLRRIGVVAALPAEARCFAPRPGETAHLDPDVWLQISGPGPERAARAANALLEVGCTALVSWGVAAGIASELAAGCLVLPECIVTGGERLPTDAPWRTALLGRVHDALPCSTGALVHSDGVVASPRDKEELFRRSGAVAVDMESGAVARAAWRAGVPFLAVRVVADPADLALPQAALCALDADGRTRPMRILGALVRRPREIPALLRLARHFRAARATLRTVTRVAGRRLAAP